MIAYRPGMDPGPLEPWPFEAPESDYVILEGAPRACGRIDAGGAGCDTRVGLWQCSAGMFDCTEQGDELMTVLAGACRVTDLTSGEEHDLAPGQSLLLCDGRRVRWQIAQTVTKVFYGWKPGGY